MWIYKEPIFFHTDLDMKNEFQDSANETCMTFDTMSSVGQYNSLKRKQRHYEEMRWTISRLVDCNFDDHTKFMTLTFKGNITDIEYSNSEFNKFLKRLNYHFFKQKKQDLKYIATWEKQRRGSIHYHVIFFNLPYIKKHDLEKLWGHGFIKINKIEVDSKENRGRYVSKYFSKDLELKEHKKKAFFTSQNLKKPYVKKLALTPEEIQALKAEPVVFEKTYSRQTFVSEAFRISDEPDAAFKDSTVHYLKIKKNPVDLHKQE